MAYSISGGTFTEDFNYGNSGYTAKVAPLPGEFSYSTSEKTNDGEIVASWYARRNFTLQYGSHALNKLNKDVGLHGGYVTGSGPQYYFLFPLISWFMVQTLTLEVVLSADGVLTYHRSYDGHVNDVHSLVVNEKVRDTISNTAGHPWAKSTVNLSKGVNKITWAVESADHKGGFVRNGLDDLAQSGNYPILWRYFRIANIQITNVSSVVVPRRSYADLLGNGTLTSRAFLKEVGKVKIVALSSMAYKVKFGQAALIGESSFITDTHNDKLGKAQLVGTSTLTASGNVQHVHSSEDAGFVINTHAELTVERPLDSTQQITSLITPYHVSTLTMPTPTFIHGQPIIPTYIDTQASTWSTANSYTSTTAITPSSVSHVLPHNATYRWVSVDVSGADDAAVTTWPERNGGPSWSSLGAFCPTVHPHVHFNEKDFSYTSYSRVVTFYWRYAQHMWATLGTQTAPFTWTFVGIFSPSTKKQWQHILNSGGKLNTPGNWENDAADGINESLGAGQENAYTGNTFFGLYENGIVLQPLIGYNQYFKGHTNWRPAIYTVVCNAGSTVVYTRHRNHKWRQNTGVNNSTANNFLLGRQANYLGDEFSAHMSLMEIGFWNRALSATEVVDNEDYLMGVYALEKYV